MRQTIMLKVNIEEPEVDKIRDAAMIIRRGGLVAFPTETVYGLGADALSSRAVEGIYAAKKRPIDNPIIVHVASVEEAQRLAQGIPDLAFKLMEVFWPGPLTLVLRSSDKVPKITTGNLETVAIRMPRHRVALALIRESQSPIAAPSANLSGRPSPTTAEHVYRDLDGRIDLILDAGPTNVGVESTVLDVTVDPPQILRPGGVTHEKLKEVLDRVELHPVAASVRESRLAETRSPGTKHKHYAPNAEVILVEGEADAVVEKVQELADYHMREGKKVGILATDESAFKYSGNSVKSLGRRQDPAEMARRLFALLREFEEEVDVIIAEGVLPEDLGLAVMNRLRRASGFNIIRV